MIIAVPERLPGHRVLDLASLVLTNREYEELRNAIVPTPGTAPSPPPFPGKPGR